MSKKLLSIGKILNFQGIAGEVKVGYTKGQEHYFTRIKQMYAEKDSELISLTPQKVRFHKNNAVIKFKEINSVDEVIGIKGSLLKASEIEIRKLLVEDEFCINDLKGLEAYDNEGNKLGEVSGVSPSAGHDFLFIKDSENKEHIVPFTKATVTDVDLKAGKLTINNIEGLIDIK